MESPKLPSMPLRTRASDLINGSDADFVINAYLALQRHWPDAGGYAHYLYFLSQNPAQRLAVLREIAGSDAARHCGAELEVDLPDQYLYAPATDVGQSPRDTAVSLRVTKAIAEVEALKQSIASLTLDGLSGALEAVVQAQQASLAALESHLNDVRGEVQEVRAELALRAPALAAPSASVPADDGQAVPAADVRWIWAELDRMKRRVENVESQGGGDAQVQSALAEEVSSLRAEVRALRNAASLDVKRQVADYFKSLSGISTGSRPVLANDANLQPAGLKFRHA